MRATATPTTKFDADEKPWSIVVISARLEAWRGPAGFEPDLNRLLRGTGAGSSAGGAEPFVCETAGIACASTRIRSLGSDARCSVDSTELVTGTYSGADV